MPRVCVPKVRPPADGLACGIFCVDPRFTILRSMAYAERGVTLRNLLLYRLMDTVRFVCFAHTHSRINNTTI